MDWQWLEEELSVSELQELRAWLEEGTAAPESLPQKLDDYLRPVLAEPLTDERSLSIRHVCKVVGCSSKTLYARGLHRRVRVTQEFRAAARRKAGVGRDTRTGAQIQRLQEQRDAWKKRYEDLLEAFVNLQYAVRLVPGVDMEVLLKTSMPKPNRSRPGGRSRGRGKEGRKWGLP